MAEKRPCTPCRIPVPTIPTLAKSRQHPQEVNNARTCSAQYQSSGKGKETAAKMPCPSKGKIKLTTSKAMTMFGGTPSYPAVKTSIPSPVFPVGRPRTAVQPPSEDRQPSGGNDFLSKESHL